MANIFDQLTAPAAMPDTPVAAESADATLTGTPQAVKAACQELLRVGVLEQQAKPNLYATVQAQLEALNAILEPLDLLVRVDDVRGLAWLQVLARSSFEGEDEWGHPLVRRQRLTLEQSLLVALLRQHYVVHEQERGIGATEARVALEDLQAQLQLYLGDMGSDSREQQRLRTLLEKLRPHGIVSEIDEHEQVGIRPIIVHLASPENLQNLLHAFRAASGAVAPVSDAAGEDD